MLLKPPPPFTIILPLRWPEPFGLFSAQGTLIPRREVPSVPRHASRPDPAFLYDPPEPTLNQTHNRPLRHLARVSMFDSLWDTHLVISVPNNSEDSSRDHHRWVKEWLQPPYSSSSAHTIWDFEGQSPPLKPASLHGDGIARYMRSGAPILALLTLSTLR